MSERRLSPTAANAQAKKAVRNRLKIQRLDKQPVDSPAVFARPYRCAAAGRLVRQPGRVERILRRMGDRPLRGPVRRAITRGTSASEGGCAMRAATRPHCRSGCSEGDELMSGLLWTIPAWLFLAWAARGIYRHHRAMTVYYRHHTKYMAHTHVHPGTREQDTL